MSLGICAYVRKRDVQRSPPACLLLPRAIIMGNEKHSIRGRPPSHQTMRNGESAQRKSVSAVQGGHLGQQRWGRPAAVCPGKYGRMAWRARCAHGFQRPVRQARDHYRRKQCCLRRLVRDRGAEHGALPGYSSVDGDDDFARARREGGPMMPVAPWRMHEFDGCTTMPPDQKNIRGLGNRSPPAVRKSATRLRRMIMRARGWGWLVTFKTGSRSPSV